MRGDVTSVALDIVLRRLVSVNQAKQFDQTQAADAAMGDRGKPLELTPLGLLELRRRVLERQRWR